MTREVFIESINAIQEQLEYDTHVASLFGNVFPDAFEANLLPKNHILQNALVHVLQQEMNDTTICSYGMTWIEYFMWELEFGAKYKTSSVTVNGEPVSMKTAGDLYEFLTEHCKKGDLYGDH